MACGTPKPTPSHTMKLKLRAQCNHCNVAAASLLPPAAAPPVLNPPQNNHESSDFSARESGRQGPSFVCLLETACACAAPLHSQQGSRSQRGSSSCQEAAACC